MNARRIIVFVIQEIFKDIQFNNLLINNFKICSLFTIKTSTGIARLSDLQLCILYIRVHTRSTTRALCVRVAEHAGRSYRTEQISYSMSVINQHSKLTAAYASMPTPVSHLAVSLAIFSFLARVRMFQNYNFRNLVYSLNSNVP